MKTLKLLLLSTVLLFGLNSCSSVKVASDYDAKVNLSDYKTFAFYKPGVDKLDMSDLDKKRLLRAIDREMQTKGFTKSTDPDFMINVFTKTKEKINVYQNNMYGYGYYGWNPYWWGGPGFYGPNNISIDQYTEGTIFIDFIDVDKRELYWQGIGAGAVSQSTGSKKEKRINEFVGKILNQYPNVNAE